MTHEGEPKREVQLILPEEAGETEKALYEKYIAENLTLKEVTDARPPKAPESVRTFYHDLINALISRFEAYRTELDAMIKGTDEYELSLVDAYDLDYSELAVFEAWKNGRLREVKWPNAFQMTEKLESAGHEGVKKSVGHFYGWLRNKLAIELGREELAEMRRKKLEENK